MPITYMDREALPMDGSWHLEIAERADVMTWWYGNPGAYWEEPDQVQRMNRYHRDVIDWAFSFPETVKGLNPPVELERATLCIWRWSHNRTGGGRFYVAHSPDHAVELAIAHLEQSTRVSDRPKFRHDHIVRYEVYTDFDRFFEEVLCPQQS